MPALGNVETLADIAIDAQHDIRARGFQRLLGGLLSIESFDHMRRTKRPSAMCWYNVERGLEAR